MIVEFSDSSCVYARRVTDRPKRRRYLSQIEYRESLGLTSRPVQEKVHIPLRAAAYRCTARPANMPDHAPRKVTIDAISNGVDHSPKTSCKPPSIIGPAAAIR